jgi:hypothetical protein
MSAFRLMILLQSALSGAVLGLMAGAVLFAAGTGVWLLMPDAAGRVVARARVIAMAFCFVVLPLAGAVLGWLEGRLKL